MARVIRDTAAEGVEVPGLSLRLLEIAPGAQIELAGDGETMAYVVEGRGTSALGPVEPESLVWLDPGDTLDLEAGSGGLRLLVGHTG